jgi:hypothetical protein
MRRLVLIALVASVLVAIPAAGASAKADKPIRDSGTFSFSGLDDEATEICGFDIGIDVEGRFSVLLRFTKTGGLLVTDHSVFHATHTNLDTGKYTTTNGSSTAHVTVGAGTDGREVVKITGLQGHIVTPGSGASTQDSGQLVIEAFGPDDPNPIFVSAHGLFEGMGGPYPELCEALS